MTTPKAEKGDWARRCRVLLDNLNALKADLVFPAHFKQGDEVRREGDFNANDYFKVFKHLRMRDGFVLDYMYHMDSFAGFPILYARENTEEPFPSKEQFDQEMVRRNGSPKQAQDDFMRYIEMDGTEDAFFEIALLNFFGPQFYLFWHAAFHDAQLICDSSDLEAVKDELEGYDLELPLDVELKSKLIDTTPAVKVGDEAVTVRFVYFTKWGGFIETFRKLDKASGAVLEVRDKTLVDFDCGINY